MLRCHSAPTQGTTQNPSPNHSTSSSCIISTEITSNPSTLVIDTVVSNYCPPSHYRWHTLTLFTLANLITQTILPVSLGLQSESRAIQLYAPCLDALGLIEVGLFLQVYAAHKCPMVLISPAPIDLRSFIMLLVIMSMVQ